MPAAPSPSPNSRPSPPPLKVLRARQLVLSTEELAVSIVLAFHDPRARAEAVRTWLQGQTLPGHQYEVVVVTDGSSPVEEKKLMRHLRSQDVLARCESCEPGVLWNAGAELARGERLYFVSDLSLAEPDGVELAARVLDDLEVDCAAIRWSPLASTYVARFEEKAAMESLAFWEDPANWRKPVARGFVITRRVFQSAGRFPVGYGHFAPALLGARLHKGGIRTGYSTEPGVKLPGSRTLAELAGKAWNHAHHECLAATRYQPEFFHRYFDRPRVLLSSSLPQDEARSALSLVGRELDRVWQRSGDFEPKARLIAAWVRLWLRTFGCQFHGRAARIRASIAVAWHWLGCQFWRFSEDRRYGAFRKFKTAVVHHARVTFVTRRSSLRRPLANSGGQHTGRALDMLHGWGLHPVEVVDGQHLRWTGGLAVVPFRLPEGVHEVTLHTGGFRDAGLDFPFEIYWDRHRVPKQKRRVEQHRVIFRASSPGGERLQKLIIMVPQLLPRGTDGRELGFPLTGISVAGCESPQEGASTTSNMSSASPSGGPPCAA